MGYYINVIEMALTYFPLVGATFIIPYLVVQYRRYGKIHSWYALVNLLAIFYLLTVFCLVNLPFPDSMDYAPKEPQLKLFAWWRDFTVTQEARGGNYSLLAILSNSVIYQQLFNILMFIPLGVYLRYVRKQKLWFVLIASFTFSLLLEVIQLSGFLFLFSGAYRFFDVDDLFTNVFGALIGYGLGALPERYYPLEKQHTPTIMEDVSTLPKVLSVTIDTLVVVGVNRLLFLLFPENLGTACMVTASYFIGIPYMTQGKTLGRHILQIKLMPSFGRSKEISLKNIVIKHTPIIVTLGGCYFFVIQGPSMPEIPRTGLLGIFTLTLVLYWGASFIKKKQVLFDAWSNLRLCPEYRYKHLPR